MENRKAILESLERLKLNSDYQYLCTHLQDMKEVTERMIYDESLEHRVKESLIIKRNTIKNFIELPEDLIQEFAQESEWEEES